MLISGMSGGNINVWFATAVVADNDDDGISGPVEPEAIIAWPFIECKTSLKAGTRAAAAATFSRCCSNGAPDIRND